MAQAAWLDALRSLAFFCADGDASEASGLLIEMNQLLQTVPSTACMEGVKPIEATRMDALLRAEAYESAAMAMLDHGTGYLMSRSGDGHSLATVSLPRSGQEHSGSGNTPALALIGALAISLASQTMVAPSPSRRVGIGTRLALH